MIDLKNEDNFQLPDLPQPVDGVKEHDDDSFFAIPDINEPSSEHDETTLIGTPPLTEESPAPESADELSELWSLAAVTISEKPKYLTWEAFEAHTETLPQTCYISEAGPSAFDAALTDPSFLGQDNSNSVLVDTGKYVACLLALGLGRSSVFYSYNEKSKKFESTVEIIRTSGCSTELIESITNTLLKSGNLTKALEEHTQLAYSQRLQTPARTALAESLTTVLRTIQAHLTIPASSLRSILHLHSLFEPVLDLLSTFSDLLAEVRLAKTDEEVLSRMYTFIQGQEHRTDGSYLILLEVLDRVSRPFLDFVASWSGLQPELGIPLTKTGEGKSFVKCEARVWIDDQGGENQTPDFVLDKRRVPYFVPLDDVQTMFESGRSLRFIRDHHPEHPMTKPEVIAEAKPPGLAWEFEWQGIERVEKRAKEYETSLRAAIARFSSKGSTDISMVLPDHCDIYDDETEQFDLFGKPDFELGGLLTLSLQPSSTPAYLLPAEDRLSTTITAFLNQVPNPGANTTFPPPLSLLPSLCLSPILRVQSSVLNYTTLALLFTSHDLREHLRVQRQFQLLGNGLFSTHLSHSLFAPDLETAERVKGVARTGGAMGLRLGVRDSWPPATSELRLALMGILTEAYTPHDNSKEGQKLKEGKGKTKGYLSDEVELPGDLSFGIRDLDEGGIEKCLNAEGIEALDFLRLSYKAPAALSGVMSPNVLGMYDRVFRLLLRVMRMSYVVKTLWEAGREGRVETRRGKVARFRVEALHFVMTVAGYFFDVGIDKPWRMFQGKIDEVESLIASDEHARFGENDGIEGLRMYHEKVLTQILSGCLLRKRQQPVMGVLEEIWDFVLQFELKTRRGAEMQEVEALYDKFQRKVGVFLTVLRGMSEKNDAGRRRDIAGSHGMFDARPLEADAGAEVKILVQRLEMSGYYASR